MRGSMADMERSTLSVDLVIEHISRGHAFNKHVLGHDHSKAMKGLNAFRETESHGYYSEQSNRWIQPQRLGDDLFVETPDDLTDYIKNTFLTSPHLIGYVSQENGGVNLYNPQDNVALHISWNNKDHDFGSIYRYPDTAKRFMQAAKLEKREAELEGLPFTPINNMDDPQSAVKAIETLISNINAHPQQYLFKSRNPESTVQNRVLGNISRPGRDWLNDEVLHAPINAIGHSQVYAKENKLDAQPSDCICMETLKAEEFNVGRARKSLHSGRIIRSIKHYDLENTTDHALELS